MKTHPGEQSFVHNLVSEMKGVIERLPESSWLKLFEDKKLKRSRPNLHFLEILLIVWFGSFQRESAFFKPKRIPNVPTRFAHRHPFATLLVALR